MEEIILSVNLIWVMLGTILVFFMHAGFAMVEAGFTRSKNAVNIIMKNFLTISLGGIVYFLCGYAIMFGDTVGGIFGISGFALNGVDDLSFFIFQAMFAATGATILSGAVAERTNIFAYIGIIILMSLVVYPVVGHWVWSGQGWLTDLGFVDFAGSTVVHLTGAVAAFVAAVMVGPRLGKYENGRVNVITGHSIPLGALGVFLLWFGWFGFNGASTLAADPELVPNVIANTFFAAAAGVVATAFYTKFRYGHIDGSLTLNGALAGLVGITAGAANVSIIGSIIIGLIAAPLLVEGVRFLEWKLKVDDPVGAIAVHGICGVWGTLAVGLFDSNGQGLFYGGGLSLLGIQAVGVIATIAWVSVSVTAGIFIIKAFVPLRVTAEEEIAGLDVIEHGAPAYEFQDIFKSSAVRGETFAHRLTHFGKTQSNVQQEEQHI
ncbi:ammonium transporter [Lysinibacillus sphaericus]|uniref:Ammonium transporter n=3 Tax=Lysinibacillus TaxID=400634 RepID=W7S310_LYSSH|nr:MULTISPECIES: ammonium transporter [Lysinibacillus]MBE5086315.1 ammonium transporter [Bacillus thuringiensis]ACA37819.1 Putative ammonium transporter [Lysinibacillus sphaericus C3-41]AMO32020.1 ammonium transporter [Lysinibacillus sphaericus]AMR88861.1 ammonium transporter [Lysinibacillus sphaericus]ANA46932.1 ammonium transporter [Lysinibacillus sphaericus]